MVETLLFLGGSSASGKSTAAAYLSKCLNLHCVHLDEFHAPLDKAIRAQVMERGSAIDLTEFIGRKVVESFVTNGTSCIIEGGWLSVSQADTLTKNARFIPVFCGYPEAEAEQRWHQIRKSPGHHWLKTYDEKSALDWLNQQIRESGEYRDECAAHGITFVDCSDLENATRNIVSRVLELVH